MLMLRNRIEKILSEIGQYVYSDTIQVTDFKIKEDIYNGLDTLKVDIEEWDNFRVGDKWSGYDKHFWFRTQIEIPESFHGKTVVLQVTTGREHAWDSITPQLKAYINGVFTQGLDLNHREVKITECGNVGEVFNIDLHAHTGMDDVPLDLNVRVGTLVPEVETLYFNIKVIMGTAKVLREDDKRRIDLIENVNNAVNILDLRKPYSKEFYNSVNEANEYLEEKIFNSDLWHENITAHCIGHTHIDVAWRWTVDQTRHKAARSFATALNLMKDYPEYKFLQSQPQLYKFVKEDEPEIFEEIKERVKEGRWEADGGMWVEADCNLISGESMVRQFLFGTRFFEKEFGVENKLLWLPDVFGYSSAMPQILKKCGLDYFITSKLSWSEYNQFPYDTFKWKGIDGTEILTHFICNKDHGETANDYQNGYYTAYGGMLTPSQVAGGWERYQQKNLNSEVLHPFGYGDGGGGPTKEMLENARRMSKGIPGMPKVKMGMAREYMENLEKEVKNHKRLPKWVGELYLEYHRGTYTSMGKNKKYNRQSEFLYEDIESISTLNGLVDESFKYPQQQLNEGWELILLNQFHDIIPGCSIPEVYETSHKQYEEVLSKGNEMLSSGVNNIASKIDLDKESIVVFNNLGFERTDIVEIELPEGYGNVEVYNSLGDKLASQMVEVKNEQGNLVKRVMFLAEEVPAKGYKAFELRKVDNNNVEQGVMEVDKNKLSNKFINVQLDDKGNITSIFDKIENREVLKENSRGNVLQAFEDKPVLFDAWDINMYYQEKMWEVDDVQSIEVIENGPLRSGLRIKRNFLDSTIEQDIYIYDHTSRVDFKTTVDWKEQQILLKAAFPVDIHTEKATYEIQFGNVERPTHWNTSWDAARFEVCGHKWADLSEDNYGVSLLNDCKYGYDIKEDTMRLTLLKSGIYPNPNADKDIHHFTYSIFPHSGDWKEANTVREAYELNNKLQAKLENAHEGELAKEYSMVKVDKGNVMLEVVKKSEDGDDIIVRMFEYMNRRSKATVTFCKDLESVVECNLLEKDMDIVKVDGNKFSFEIKPYEVKTFKLKVGK